MAREADVVRSLVEMADTLVDDFDVVELADRADDRCVRLLTDAPRPPSTAPSTRRPGPRLRRSTGPAAGRSSLR